MYRPEGWEKKYPNPCLGCEDNDKYISWDCRAGYCRDSCTQEDEYNQFEAGADAMLEGLKKSGTYGHLFDDCILSPKGAIVGLKGYDEGKSKDGTFVFIPEEE